MTAECKHHAGYACVDQTMPHLPDPERKLPKRKRRIGNEFRLAQMLSILLAEEHDDAQFPHEVRLEQASRMLSAWSDAQGSLMAAIREVIRIKYGYCVRCPEFPCPVCGADENTTLPV